LKEVIEKLIKETGISNTLDGRWKMLSGEFNVFFNLHCLIFAKIKK
jgi:hypothetical protein